MMQKIQRFGGAMFTPVLLFAFSGIVIGVCTVFQSDVIMGSIAASDTTWFKVWYVVKEAAWTIFRQVNLLFVISLPIGLAKKQNARACMESFVLYCTFNYALAALLSNWGSFVGIDYAIEAGSGTGLASVASIKTLDTGMVGALIVAGVAVWLHNRYFDTKLPEWLGVFRGSSFVAMIGFPVMIGLAVIFFFIWPQVQHGIAGVQTFIISSGALGVWVYTFLERILIPTGLHHFIYMPFMYDSVAIEGGIKTAWVAAMPEIAKSTASLRTLFPAGGYALYGFSKIVFKFIIEKFDFKTPGREDDDEEVKLVSKAEYKASKEDTSNDPTGNIEVKGGDAGKAAAFLAALGGKDNIESVTNCATRLRVSVKDETLVQPVGVFKKAGAHGLVAKGKAFQVIVGLTVPYVREEFEKLL